MEFKTVEGKAAGFEDARAVRLEVFCEEQGFSRENELDDTDAVAWHVTGYVDGAPVCTGRVFWHQDGDVHLGRVAVKRVCRGKGTGAQLMERLTARAQAMGAKRAVLDAQADKAAFYAKQGFVCTGETSMDEGVPHVRMAKPLDERMP